MQDHSHGDHVGLGKLVDELEDPDLLVARQAGPGMGEDRASGVRPRGGIVRRRRGRAGRRAAGAVGRRFENDLAAGAADAAAGAFAALR